MKPEIFRLPGIKWTDKPEYLGIKWPGVKDDVMPKPFRELTVEQWAMLMLKPGLGMEGLGFMTLHLSDATWDAWLYYYPHMVLMGMSTWSINEMYLPVGARTKGVIDHGHYGATAMRLYRVGCEHPKLEIKNLPRMMKLYQCPDCGYSSTNSTDG